MITRKNDFIELDFTAKVKNGTIFDTTRREEALKAGLIDKDDRQEFRPLALCVGQRMVLKGLDEALENKEVGKEYEIELQPEKAFGKRNSRLIKTAPLSAFRERPVIGMLVNVDGIIARVVNVTSGRALLDFNSPLAGKTIVYNFKINKIIDDNNEKIKILTRAFGLETENVKIENGKVSVKFKKANQNAIKEFAKKVEELLDLELCVE